LEERIRKGIKGGKQVMRSNFDREFNGMKKTMVGTMVFGVILNLVFWVGLIYGAFWTLNHFGIIEKLLG
jgi:hypothetical protein